MVGISQSLQALVPDDLTLYYTTEPLLSELPILLFYGPASTTNLKQSSWRIQAHIFTPAGLQSYTRITTSPNSPLYAAVRHLPPDQQGDELRRGFAISLLKYFADMPDVVKKSIVETFALERSKDRGLTPVMFDEWHAGTLASKMVRVENISEVVKDLEAALSTKSISHLDIDVLLPSSFRSNTVGYGSRESMNMSDEDASSSRYGEYASLVKLFGSPTFLPTSKLQRAPSKPLGPNRNKTMTVEQEESIKREMSELVETEERYVAKLDELVVEVAERFRISSKLQTSYSSSPDEHLLRTLFPESLDQILDVNSQFLEEIRSSLEQLFEERAGIEDAVSRENMTLMQKGEVHIHEHGIVQFSRTLSNWIPRFSTCYGNYLMASSGFPEFLSRFLKDSGSSFSQRVRETGEQKLRAMLIEPVQRLPRYSLFIDNITAQLPSKHPALPFLLQARDAIASICALEASPSSRQSQPAERLRKLVASWPQELKPQGRLVTAAEFIDVSAPFRLDKLTQTQTPNIFLLFPEYLISVRRNVHSSLTARGVLAEVDRPGPQTIAASVAASTTGQAITPPLTFTGCIPLRDIRFSESGDGRLVYLISPNNAKSIAAQISAQDPTRSSSANLRAFYLLGSFEGRVARWTEEIAKARIEGRFSEEERNSENWELRNLNMADQNLTVFSAILSQEINGSRNRGTGSTTLSIEVGKGNIDTGHAVDVGLGANMSLLEVEDNIYRLETRFYDGHSAVDEVNAASFPSVLARRIGDLLNRQGHAKVREFASGLIYDNAQIIRSLTIQLESDQAKSRIFRPPSPVKLLSSFLGGGNIKDPASPQKPNMPKLGEIPVLVPTPRKLSRSGSQKARNNHDAASKVTLVSTQGTDCTASSLQRIEETLISYVVAINARQGDIIGSVLRGRQGADELAVNEVYNTLLEDPANSVIAEAPVAVIFVAFEKFLKRAWSDRMGSVVNLETLNAMQEQAGTLLPLEFEAYFRTTTGEMAPQNRRALKAIVRLLADLLEASGNDGDRGALTATFAELLVTEGNPHLYISLLDRLVEDYDRLFEDSSAHALSGDSTPMYGSTSSSKRARSTNTGSMSSNASSLRKRFGFPSLSRENSKHEPESKVGSVWRTLSKTAKIAVSGDSVSVSDHKVPLSRSKSTDTHGRMLPPSRPISRDRPTVLGAFAFESPSRPSSSRGPHTPIAEVASPERTPAGTPRRKRRSSLSDLKALRDSPQLQSFSPLPRPTPDSVQRARPSPRTPSPSKSIARLNYSTAGSLRGKENSPAYIRGTLAEIPPNIQPEDGFVSQGSPSKKSNPSASGIPIPKGALRDRPSATYAESPVFKPLPSPQKLRLQSPQKLRDRLQAEQKALAEADKGLQLELSKIGEEIALLPRPNYHQRLTPSTSPSHSHAQSQIQSLTDRLSSLQSTYPSLVQDLTSRTAALEQSTEASLQALESRAKKLEELYRDSNAENELLYERFNAELAKISQGVRAGQPERALLERLRESQDEVGRVKRENVRLRREAVAGRGGAGVAGRGKV